MSETRQVTDKQGRSITVKRLSAVDRLRVKKAIPAGMAEPIFWLNDALVAASVTEIAGVPIIFPISESAVEAIVAQLDSEGMEAAAPVVIEFSNPSLTKEEEETAKN